jgi:Na+/proline symporter/nitrogen-specific signal transduction histidine kinase
MSQPIIIAVAVAYLLVLFAVAWMVEHSSGRLSRLTGSSLVYTLSLAVYCSSWTFNGGVGRASRTGLDFLPIYLGPTLAFCLGPVLIRKMMRISHAHRITSIADLIGARFGKRASLAALVTIIATLGLLPYIALQLKSISSGFLALSAGAASADPTGGPLLSDGALWAAIVLTVFAMLFGSRSIRPGEHHPGMVVAVAMESILKLIALTAIGLFVGYWLFDGLGDLFTRAGQVPEFHALFAGSAPPYGYNWITMTFLAGLAIFCLPRQFQVMVVENVDARHLNRALWLFPLYLLAINLFVLPIALAGRIMLPASTDPDNLVLALPFATGHPLLALIAFLGGLSAAASMVVVETTALSLMICNDVVMPALLRVKRLGLAERADLTQLLLWIRRAAMILIMTLGYLYMRHDSAQFALVSIGLVSFAAVAQFAPAIIGGLFWRGATTAGAFAGITTGFLVWFYTLLLPSFVRSGAFAADFVEHGPFGIALLKPYALFGLNGLDPITHCTFWSMLANAGAFVAVSLAGRQSPLERARIALFVESIAPGEAAQIWRRTALVPDLMSLTARFLGREKTATAFADFARTRGVDPTVVQADAETVLFYERLLAGVIGAASARVLVGTIVEEEPLGVDEMMRILDETSRVIEANRQLEEKSQALETATTELRDANARLQVLDRLKDDFVATVNHELRTPLASIRAFSEILREHSDLSRAERLEFLGIIVTESERLTRLINQLLDLSKIEATESMPAENGPVDLAAVVRESAAAMRQVFAKDGATLRIDVEAEHALVVGDHDRLVQVMINLLGNAAKFAPPGRGRATLGLRRHGDELELSVSDNGPGIRAEDREIVFERFRQLGDTMTEKPQGAGLGLAISRRIVTQHGGRIWVEGAENGGAVFKLRLKPAAAGMPARSTSGALA